MSTTGHYTRYINQYNEKYGKKWSDNCDSMFQPISSPLEGICEFCKYNPECSHDHRNCYDERGYLTVEHTHGNKRAFLTFTYKNPGYNYWQWIKEQTEYIGPLKPGRRFTLIDHTGKLAIQHVVEQSEKVNVWDLVDLIFKNEFYNRSYVDYFKYYLSEVDINV